MDSHWGLIFLIIHTTATHTDLQFCKEYNVSGENYSEFFHIDSFKPSATVADADDTVINLRLYWMASQSAHILLSSNNNIDTSARVYEIGVILHGSSYIKRQNSPTDSSNSTISGKMNYSTDMTPFTIRANKSGNITIAITGQPAFLSYFDKDLWPLKYISFSPKVKWLFDCESPADEEDKLEPINQDLERLQNDLFEQYDATVAPNDLSTFSIELAKARFIADKSFMTSHGRFRADWIDERLMWDSSEYADTYQFVLRNTSNEQIWTPKLRTLNVMNGELIALPLMYSLTVTSSGHIFAESNDTIISTMCLKNQQNWPYESVECNLQIQLDDVVIIKVTPLKYNLAASYSTDRIDLVGQPATQHNDPHHWRVSHVKMAARVQTMRTANDANDQISLKKSTTLELNVSFQEDNSLFSQLFSVPVLGNVIVIVMAIISFRQKHHSALILNIIGLITLFIMLMLFSIHGPNNYTPTVVICYTHSLFFAWCFLLVAAIRCVFKERKPYV